MARSTGAVRRRRKAARLAEVAKATWSASRNPYAPKLSRSVRGGGLTNASSEVAYINPKQRRVIGGACVWPERFGHLVATDEADQPALNEMCGLVRRLYLTDAPIAADLSSLTKAVDKLVSMAHRGLLYRRIPKTARVCRATGFSPRSGGRGMGASDGVGITLFTPGSSRVQLNPQVALTGMLER